MGDNGIWRCELVHTARRLFAIGLASFVMLGRKRVEDARKRAYDPRIHRKKRFIRSDGLPGQARQ